MRTLLLLLTTALFTACVGDDIVDDYVTPVIRIDNLATEIEAGTTHQYGMTFFNNVGQMEEVSAEWTSADPAVLTVDNTGLATGVAEGSTTVSLTFTDEFGETVSTTEGVTVGASTVVVEEPAERRGTVATTSTYPLMGDFVLAEIADTDNLDLSFDSDYEADDSLPGLYVYLSNNPNSTSGAYEIGRVETFSGAHNYEITGVAIDDYRYVLYFCKPFNIKVGVGEITE